MDTNMMDVDIDVDLDAFEVDQMQAQKPTLTIDRSTNEDNDAPMPAAYYESLETFKPTPELLNIQGGTEFDRDAPIEYALEHYPERRPKRIRWVNDNSVSIEYDNAQDAADALLALTHPDAGDPTSIPAQTSRKAQTYSVQPHLNLTIREANTGDQKEKNAANRSDFYKRNPKARARDNERGRRRPPPQYLDYDGVDTTERSRRGGSFDDAMYDDGPSPNNATASRDRRRNYRDSNREGRQSKEVDSYRPGSDSPRESRFGRLRGRSASPASDEDGRYGFAEEGASARRYRSRSRDDRRRHSRSREREFRKRPSTFGNGNREQDGSITYTETGRWAKNTRPNDAFPHKTDMSNHRRTDAHDETNKKGSLLSRMTKDGKPLVPSAARSLASRITRGNEESSYGRLKDDDSEPQENNFQDEAPLRRDLARSPWIKDGGKGRRSSDQDNGFSIRGTAPQGGFSIRGAAGGD